MGDRVAAVNGEAATQAKPPSALLQRQASGTAVKLELISEGGGTGQAREASSMLLAAAAATRQPAAVYPPSSPSKARKTTVSNLSLDDIQVDDPDPNPNPNPNLNQAPISTPL